MYSCRFNFIILLAYKLSLYAIKFSDISLFADILFTFLAISNMQLYLMYSFHLKLILSCFFK